MTASPKAHSCMYHVPENPIIHRHITQQLYLIENLNFVNKVLEQKRYVAIHTNGVSYMGLYKIFIYTFLLSGAVGCNLWKISNAFCVAKHTPSNIG